MISTFVAASTLALTSAAAQVYDLQQDYSTNNNPAGPWSYGWENQLGGAFTRFTVSKWGPGDNGVPVHFWAINNSEPSATQYNPTTNTATCCGGAGVYPPKSLVLLPGIEGHVDNFAVVRFTVPAGADGNYRLKTAVRTYLDGSLSGDADFHVLRNGVELFGQSVPGNGQAGYSNTVTLAAGDTIDFAVGRGADNIAYASGLKIHATLERVSNLPSFNAARDYSTNNNPAGPWSYGWENQLGGAFTRFTVSKWGVGDNGVPVHYWAINNIEPSATQYNPTTNTATCCGGAGAYPPKSLVLLPGIEGRMDNFGVVRFTVPGGAGGHYRIETAVRAYLDGSLSGDADFHVLRNGIELFGQFVPANGQAGYSNTVALAAGDTLDFAVGRGADNSAYASGLKIEARLTPVELPVQPGTFDASRDFSTNTNPGGPWSYGHKSELSGGFNLFPFKKVALATGVPMLIWAKNNFEPSAVFYNFTTNTAISDGGGVYPPGTVIVQPGIEGHADNFGVIRLTLPSGQEGTYRLETSVRSYLDGPRSGDTDFHVVRNGAELFGQMVPGNSEAGYTNTLTLAAGDTIDFAVGRGADNRAYDSGLKIQARLDLISTEPMPPSILTQPRSQTVLIGANVTFTVQASGTGPLSYQWLRNGDEIEGATSAALTLHDVQLASAGTYSVIVSNALGSVTSSDALLTVNPPPTDFDISRDYSTNNNPAGPWSYGWENQLGGAFTRFTVSKWGPGDNGVPVHFWAINNSEPSATQYNPTTNTATCCGGAGVYPPKSLVLLPGIEGHADNFAVVRFTVPAGACGNYRLETAVRAYLDGSLSGDADFHVLWNGVELFGQFVPGNGQTGYSNTVALAAGDTIDFAVGRGADNSAYASGLKIHATLERISIEPVPPSILTQPRSQTVLIGANVTFTVHANGTGPLSYQWLRNEQQIEGATSAALTLHGVQLTNSGNYSVVVSNAQGSITSSNAVLTVNPPPTTFNLSLDFSTNSNPNGAWSYGWQTVLGEEFVLLSVAKPKGSDNGVPLVAWQKPPDEPVAVFHNPTSETATSDGGQGTYPPGTTWFYPGVEGHADNYGVIRFTLPPAGDGTYSLETAVRSYLDGPRSADTDFHVLLNGIEIFGRFLPGNSQAGYTNTLTLAAGDTIDFAVGRGADNIAYDSGLKIQATLERISTEPVPPSILTQPQSQTVLIGASVTFAVQASGTGPLSYQWLRNGDEIDGATAEALTLHDVQLASTGSYSVVVSNAQGSITSSDAILTVNAPATNFDVSRDYSTNSNPGGPWSYGYKTELGGVFSLFTFSKVASTDNGVPLQLWAKNNYEPAAVFYNYTTNTAICCYGGAGVFPPGTVIVQPGIEGHADNYGVIRFTVPSGGDGTYTLTTSVRSYLDGPRSGDTDFHVVRNGTELFGQFVPGNGQASYSNTLALAAGDVIDFAVGRGADNVAYDSGLKVQARLVLVSTEPDARTFVVGSPPDREEGKTVSVPVQLVSTGDVGGFTLVLNYNPDHLSVANVDFDSALRDAFVQWNVPQLGQLRMVVGTEGEAFPGGTQIVATVNFRARTVVADSTSQLRLQVVDVSSPTGDILANTGVRNGEVTVLTTGSTDNNANDRLDVGDATLLMRLLAGMDTQRTWDLDRNDRNLNRLLDSGDAIKLLRIINELDPPPAEAPLLAASGGSASPAGELAFLTPSRSQAAAGQLLRVQVRLENLESTISGAAFTLSYPANALRLAASQPHRTGTMVSGNSLASWNATAPGQVRLVVSSDSPWLSREGVLAEITFEVLPGAADQHIWPLALGAVEVTPDGYAPRAVATQGAEFIGRPALAGTLSAPRYGSSGEFIFSLTGDPGATYSIQASTDLVNWDTLTSALNATGTIEFTDSDAASFSRRFYRVVPAE